MNVIDSILRHEGFRSTPYPDPILGWDKPTFGHGLTYITADESKAIVVKRVGELHKKIHASVPFYNALPVEVRDVLVEMAYQMGVGGLLRFKKMLAALEQGDFGAAAKEMLDSKWARQTPERAQELATRVLNADPRAA